jgi:hypothetical protein
VFADQLLQHACVSDRALAFEQLAMVTVAGCVQ